MDHYANEWVRYSLSDNICEIVHDDVQKHIESHGYRCVYLPPYSPESIQLKNFGLFSKASLKENSCWMRKH